MTDEAKAEHVRRWHAAAHAMQTGVAYQLEIPEFADGQGSPKHLRVGVNVALSDHGALVDLLIKKGVITEEEYLEAIADKMEEERDRYQDQLQEYYRRIGPGGSQTTIELH